MEECCTTVHPTSIEGEKKNEQQQIQLKLSTIFKHKVIDTAQTFGSFYDAYEGKYCAISVLSKYLGYDIATASRNNKNTNPAELIPYDILEMIENFATYSSREGNLKCFCSKPDYYYHYSLISLLIHLNDYHKMTFNQIGNWLENIDM
jgi:hypothetical protein